jgi:biotin carboxylase
VHENKHVLIVGGGHLQVPLIQEALSLGVQVVLTDRDAVCPGRALTDHFWQVDTSDVAGHRQLGQRLYGQVAGVVTAGADCAPSVAAAAEGAGVRGIPFEIAEQTHQKDQVRLSLDAAELECYQPSFYLGGVVPEDMDDFPYVVKPLRERASRGVHIVHDRLGLISAVEQVQARYGEYVLIEECLTGTEHSCEIIFGDSGEVLWFNIVDRYFDYSSGIPIEQGHINPTRLGEHEQQQMLLMTLAAAKALGVTWGPFKIDAMMTAEGPKILECTARLSGGWDCQWSSPVTDRHPMKLLLQLACGLPLDAQPQMAGADGHGAVAAILPTTTGILEAIQLPLWAASGEILRDSMRDRAVMMMVQPGDTIHPLEHNAQRCGFVMAHGHSYQHTWEIACTVADQIAAGMVITPKERPGKHP